MSGQREDLIIIQPRQASSKFDYSQFLVGMMNLEITVIPLVSKCQYHWNEVCPRRQPTLISRNSAVFYWKSTNQIGYPTFFYSPINDRAHVGLLTVVFLDFWPKSR